MKEQIIWEGTPSQWGNFVFYLCCVPLILVLGLGLLLAFWKYLDTRLNSLHITDQRIVEERGILSKTTDEIELYRVKDLRYEQPILLRIFGLSNIVLITTDHTNPVVVLKALDNGGELKEKLRIAIDNRRDIKGVREIDVN